jgi:hypothetical protein
MFLSFFPLVAVGCKYGSMENVPPLSEPMQTRFVGVVANVPGSPKIHL